MFCIILIFTYNKPILLELGRRKLFAWERIRSSLVAQWVKNPVLSLLWLRFNPWTQNFHVPQVWQKKKNPKNKKPSTGERVKVFFYRVILWLLNTDFSEWENSYQLSKFKRKSTGIAFKGTTLFEQELLDHIAIEPREDVVCYITQLKFNW